MTVARDIARERLALHELGVSDLVCRRCKVHYRRIVAEDVPCREADPKEWPEVDRRPHQHPVGGIPNTRRAAGPGYVDPRRPDLSWIRFVCEPSLRKALIEIAQSDGVSMSEVARRACRRYVGMPE